MNIIETVKLDFEGKKIRRKDWYFFYIFAEYKQNTESDTEHFFLKMFFSNDETKKTKYYNFTPADVLANDWEVIEDDNK